VWLILLRRISTDLPTWAKYLANCGAALQKETAPTTLILTLPTRALAAGFIATGAVIAQEESEWCQLSSTRTADPSEGDPVLYVGLQTSQLLRGIVTEKCEDSLVVRGDDGGSTRKYSGSQMLAVVQGSSESNRSAAISPNLDFLGSIFQDGIRARSFCLRSHISTVIVGNDGRLRKELVDAALSFRGKQGSIRDIIRPDKEPCGQRTVILSDRKSTEPRVVDSKSIFILDGLHAWRRWARITEGSRRIFVMDRTEREFENWVDLLRSQIVGSYLSFANDLGPPPGIESYAYRRVALGTL